MWGYKISSGELSNNGAVRGAGYAGRGEGKNNPDKIKVRMVGPIPPGLYKIGPSYPHAKLGPLTMNLDPLPGTEMFGRSAFRIHGDSAKDPGNASHGCIVLDRPLREAINASRDRILEVIP